MIATRASNAKQNAAGHGLSGNAHGASQVTSNAAETLPGTEARAARRDVSEA
jgi:hypothetical protein